MPKLLLPGYDSIGDEDNEVPTIHAKTIVLNGEPLTNRVALDQVPDELSDIATHDATVERHGLMSKADKIKLDSIAANEEGGIDIELTPTIVESYYGQAVPPASGADIATPTGTETRTYAPADIAGIVANSTVSVEPATDLAPGIIEIATQAETDAGTDATKAISPATLAGFSGQVGPAGADGADGADGATGPAGADGADGAEGPAGATGLTGPAGADGLDGATGPTGPTGATGPAGADGADGLDGGAAGPASTTAAGAIEIATLSEANEIATPSSTLAITPEILQGYNNRDMFHVDITGPADGVEYLAFVVPEDFRLEKLTGSLLGAGDSWTIEVYYHPVNAVPADTPIYVHAVAINGTATQVAMTVSASPLNKLIPGKSTIIVRATSDNSGMGTADAMFVSFDGRVER